MLDTRPWTVNARDKQNKVEELIYKQRVREKFLCIERPQLLKCHNLQVEWSFKNGTAKIHQAKP